MRGGSAKSNSHYQAQLLHDQIVNRVKNSGWTKRQDQVARDYSEWCQLASWVAFPVTYEPLSRFLSYVVVKNNSTKSLGNMVSALKCYVLRHNLPWLDESARYILKRYIGDLEFHDSTITKRARPATLDMVMQVVDSLNMTNFLDASFAVAMLLAHNGLLRASEVFSGCQVKDIIWNHGHRYFTFPLGRTKTHRKGDPLLVTISDYSDICAYKLMRNWFDQNNLWEHPDYFVFPKSDGRNGFIDFHQCDSVNSFRYRLKKHFARFGKMDTKFTGHSFRAGAATDLFASGVSIQDVQKYGRWKSMAVLIYYREEAVIVAKKAANAFAKAIRVHKNENRRRGIC